MILPPDRRPDRPRTPAATAAHLLERLPLAHAALALFRYALDPAALEALFDRHRGRSYQDVVTFPHRVGWLFEALTDVGSGRQAHLARDRAAAPGCDQAFSAKLRRRPVSPAVGFLQDTTARLTELLPVVVSDPLPSSLRRFEVLLLDGKALKHVAKRLASTRGTPGKLLGRKLLVAYRPRDGQVIDMAVNLDGEGNEAALVPELAARRRSRPGTTPLFVADRQFSSLKAFAEFATRTSHFVVRHAKTLTFTADPARPAKGARDRDGRAVTEEWGWVGKGPPADRRAVRRVSVTRVGDDPLAVLTDRLDGDAVPAADVLAVYRMRWDIEGRFRDVTEVFALGRFVGSTAEATVFQAAVCFVLSTLQAVMKGVIAVDRKCGLDDLSVRQIRGDWHRQLIALKELTTAVDVAAAVRPAATADEWRAELERLLNGVWRTGWAKTRDKTPPQACGEGERERGAHVGRPPPAGGQTRPRPLANHVDSTGLPLRRKKTAVLVDPVLMRRRPEGVELLQRLMAEKCELCGSTERVEVHHIRKLADLKVRGQGAPDAWKQTMAARRRKTLVLCERCERRSRSAAPAG